MKQFILLAFILILLTLHCDLTDLPVNTSLVLTLEDVSCTEAWIKVSGVTGSEIQLNRDGEEMQRFTLTTSPQIIVDDSLFPKTIYTYQAVRSGEASNTINVTTMDTTSNNFTWQIWTLGDASAGSSALYDCAIISEDNIWAVGEIKIADTSENGYTTYNAAHWNGNEWELERITVEFRGFQITPPIEGVFAFSSNDLWFVGSLPIHGDGENWTIYDLRTTVDPNLSLSKAWGTSSDNIYFVGLNGSIAHYQDGQWSKIESGTNLNFYDVWGDYNEKTDMWEILAVGSNVGTSSGSIIMKINEKNISQISSEGITGNITDIWFVQKRAYYIGSGNLFYKHRLIDSSWNYFSGINQYSVTSIFGTNINDVFIGSSGGDIIHFNGVNFKNYYNEIRTSQVVYSAIKLKENLVIAVGFLGTHAVITIGSRQP